MLRQGYITSASLRKGMFAIGMFAIDL